MTLIFVAHDANRGNDKIENNEVIEDNGITYVAVFNGLPNVLTFPISDDMGYKYVTNFVCFF